MEIFIHNVIWLRKHYRLSKKKMAALLKISPWMLNKIEHGTLPPTLKIDVLYHINQVFGVSMVDILSIHLDAEKCADLFSEIKASKS